MGDRDLFSPIITEYDHQLFARAEHYALYEKLGAHVTSVDGKEGVYFAVWAPRALAVRLVGDFNGWTGNAHVMMRREPEGIYDLFVPGLGPGTVYKYEIITQEGKSLLKADPFGNQAQLRPENSSIVADLQDFCWNDKDWIAARREKDLQKEAVSVYEVHIGSWKRNGNGFYNYREFAHEITAYAKEMGYTHIELIGIAEHPFDGSWGYQVTGYFAPTARYGSPEDFMYMIDYLHQNKISVILDWVPAHFPKDEHGLAGFDGSSLYEYADPMKGDHPDWGTKVFDYGKPEVQNFLLASALFWIEKMHVDGLRVDAVASMLYLDYGRPYGKWQPNRLGENKNLEAVEFLCRLNATVTARNPGVMMIAEESTSWPKVTGEIKDGGLGFTFKWNMGWMHDFLSYMEMPPRSRREGHHRMTFGMMYAYDENYMLPLSHDEVVHMKGSMIEKIPGDRLLKFAGLKAGYTFMIGHPGRKLLFMGQEFGQFREWSEERPLDWELLKQEDHKELRDYVKQLLYLYKAHPALYEREQSPESFCWINPDDCERCVYSFIRKSEDGQKNLLFVCNFSDSEWPEYRIGVPKEGTYRRILCSGYLNNKGPKEIAAVYTAENNFCDGYEYSFAYPLLPYGTAVFEY